MKNLLFIFAFLPMLLPAQEFLEYTMFDWEGVSTDTMAPISIKNRAIVEIDFTDINCNVLTLDIGYTLTDTKPAFLGSFAGLTFPLLMDKTATTDTYLGVEVNHFVFDFSDYEANYVWVKVNDDAGCTDGNLVIRIPR